VSVWRHIRAAVLLPGTVTLLVPWVILGGDLEVSSWVGVIPIALGVALWTWTVRLFARIGRGTLAPWDPTEHLVVEGPYRHVRNPMITAVLAVLVGEALLFGSVGLLVWAAAFFVLNCVWFVLVEEPGLEERFGEAYLDYSRSVGRWIPRRRPWSP
jgi:protein-S-isoprenylcysteine O-methyltransferase Ste14